MNRIEKSRAIQEKKARASEEQNANIGCFIFTYLPISPMPNCKLHICVAIEHLECRRVLRRGSYAPSPTAATIKKNVKEEDKSRIRRYYNDHSNASFMTCVRLYIDMLHGCYTKHIKVYIYTLIS
jgi:hypothetical protein